MMVSWDNPWMAVLAVVALLPLGFARWARRRGRASSLLVVALQMVAAGLLVMGLCGPRGPEAGQAQEWLVFEDQSPSMPELPPLAVGDASCRRVWFDQTLHRDRRSSSSPRTGINDVLDFAAADMDRIAGVILRTDGRWHDDPSVAAARLRRALEESAKPMILIPQTAPRTDAAVTAFLATRTRTGQIELAATIEANHICSRRLVIRSAAGRVVFDQTFKLLPRQSERITRTVPAAEGSRFVVELTPRDALANNQLQAAAPSPARQLAILAPDAAAWKSLLADHLKGWSILAAPSQADLLSASVVLASPASLPRLAPLPGGVVLLDAADSPLSPLVPDAQSRTPLAVTVLLDASASMGASLPGGHTPFELACEATRNLAAHLSKDDSVRVILFHSAAKEVFAGRGDQLSTFRPEAKPSGQTDVAPALRLAAATPAPAGKSPLVLVFSDLDTAKFDVAALAKTCRAAKLKLAVAAVGEASADAPLATLCKTLGASLSILNSPRQLNALFASVLMRARPPIRTDSLAILADGLAASLGKLAQPISLRLCRPRDGATVLATAGGEPLCAAGSHAGRKTATIALVSPSAKMLAPASEAVAALVTLCAPAQADPRLALSLRRTGRDVSLVLLARDKQAPLTDLSLAAKVGKQTSSLSQTAPGRYEAKFSLPVALAVAPVHAVVRDSIGRSVASGVAQAQPPLEAQTLYPDPERVKQLAADLGATLATEAELPGLMTDMKSARGRLDSVCYLLALAAMLAAWLAPVFTKPK